MINFLKKLWLVFTYGDELAEVLKKKRQEKADAERELRKHHLSLCEKHQQERMLGYYSSSNCDHCKLELKLKTTERELGSVRQALAIEKKRSSSAKETTS